MLQNKTFFHASPTAHVLEISAKNPEVFLTEPPL